MHECAFAEAVSSPAAPDALRGGDVARLVPEPLALRLRQQGPHGRSTGTRSLERDAMESLARGAARVRAPSGRDPRPLLSRSMGRSTPGGRSGVLGAAP